MRYPDKELLQRQDVDEYLFILTFIAQEAYRLAVIKQFPEDYSRILNLHRTVRDKISRFLGYDVDISMPIENIIISIVEHVVYRTQLNLFKQEMDELLSDWLDDDDDGASVQNKDEPYIFRQSIQSVIDELFNDNQGFQCNIVHKYPVGMLLIDFKDSNVIDHLFDYYYDALVYFHGLKYKPVIERDVTMKYFEDDVCIEEVIPEALSFLGRPYMAYRPFVNKALYQVDFESKSIHVPGNAFCKRESLKSLDVNDHYWLEKMSISVGSQGLDSVNLITKLNAQINIEKPISNNELDQFMASLRADIVMAQERNMNSRKLLVETEKDLIEICNTPRLLTEGIFRVKELFKTDIPYSNNKKEERSANNASHAKSLLCGLIMMCMHFVNVKFSGGVVTVSWKKRNEIILQNNMNILADKFLKDERLVAKHLKNKTTSDNEPNDYGGFSAGMIDRGYDYIKKLMKSYLNEFQRGRVQFDMHLSKAQRETLRQNANIRLDQLHADDRARAEAVIDKRNKKGQLATIKAWHNGSYVITW